MPSCGVGGRDASASDRERIQDSHAVWSVVMAAEGAQVLSFVGGSLVYRPCTVSVEPTAVRAVSRHWVAPHAAIRDDTIESFVAACTTPEPLEPSLIQAGIPLRPGTRSEIIDAVNAVDATAPGVSAFMSVSGVGFSSDNSQALVLVNSWEVREPTMFQWVVLLAKSPSGWSIANAVQADLPLTYGVACDGAMAAVERPR
jgi:hypothetical protein